MRHVFAALIVSALAVAPVQPAAAQMPDARQMSGLPLPVADLPVGTVTVRVVRGSMANVVADQPVELIAGGRSLSARTNTAGRAEFTGLTPGTQVKAVTTVDGERLESQVFAIAPAGGIRVALVATDGSAQNPAAPGAAAAPSPAETGSVVFGQQSRFVFEIGEDTFNVFALLEVVNSARVPVQPPQPIAIDLPAASQGAGVLEGSGGQAAVVGKQVVLKGPFAPGSTLVQFGYALPITGASITVEQTLPVPLAQLSVMAQKSGDMQLHSPRIAEHRDMPLQGQTFIVAKGPAVPAGQSIALNFTGLPHQPQWPRNVALALALAILAAGLWGTMRTGRPAGDETERARRLESKRERLFAELTMLEAQYAAGSVDPERYATRRRELVAALERVYAEIDGEAAA